jgi:hypothetical protein
MSTSYWPAMMSRMRPRLLLAGILFVFAVSLAAQASLEAVFNRVRDAITAQEGGWQLAEGHVGPEGGVFSQYWKNRAEDITIYFQQYASVEEAADRIAKLPVTVSIGGGQPISGIGDEAVIYSHLLRDGSAVIYLRVGTATATIAAPSQGIVLRIAKVVAAQVY